MRLLYGHETLHQLRYLWSLSTDINPMHWHMLVSAFDSVMHTLSNTKVKYSVLPIFLGDSRASKVVVSSCHKMTAEKTLFFRVITSK